MRRLKVYQPPPPGGASDLEPSGPQAAATAGSPSMDAVTDLNEASLDWDAVDCVLADLDDLTKVLQLQGRDSNNGAVPVHSVVQGRDALVAGSLAALQVVYHFADQTWCDTLLREPTGARLLRMLHPERPA